MDISTPHHTVAHLFATAHAVLHVSPALSRSYILRILDISQQHGFQIPESIHRRICSRCGNIWLPGINCTVAFLRLDEGRGKRKTSRLGLREVKNKRGPADRTQESEERLRKRRKTRDDTQNVGDGSSLAPPSSFSQSMPSGTSATETDCVERNEPVSEPVSEQSHETKGSSSGPVLSEPPAEDISSAHVPSNPGPKRRTIVVPLQAASQESGTNTPSRAAMLPQEVRYTCLLCNCSTQFRAAAEESGGLDAVDAQVVALRQERRKQEEQAARAKMSESRTSEQRTPEQRASVKSEKRRARLIQSLEGRDPQSWTLEERRAAEEFGVVPPPQGTLPRTDAPERSEEEASPGTGNKSATGAFKAAPSTPSKQPSPGVRPVPKPQNLISSNTKALDSPAKTGPGQGEKGSRLQLVPPKSSPSLPSFPSSSTSTGNNNTTPQKPKNKSKSGPTSTSGLSLREMLAKAKKRG
ncbi:hypothetical protein M427DRAFT_27178 [Gonapodya prolifera JEL478]|uniref:Rpr2-domain-containing protein n=1 Tax=Gonapodya prolifera (strain JEL478) TaxID=1344416 RepID=A0A139AXU5_GONPJ|nr:hypothetical protein M427DRAFT_27178 [Gonapodya prolifera JEL478]|eukprot:KXS21540.1 hypothetical protein M427DRAFT_27178 [Gonapodya prolifera JEL478]